LEIDFLYRSGKQTDKQKSEQGRLTTAEDLLWQFRLTISNLHPITKGQAVAVNGRQNE
jgi:hypothetical protein